MFEWFRDVINEHKGVDVVKGKLEKEEKLAQEKLERFIFSKKAKRLIIALCVFAVFLSGSVIAVVINSYDTYIFGEGGSLSVIIWNAALIACAIIICFSLIIKTKKGEMVALICGFLFLLFMYLSIFVG